VRALRRPPPRLRQPGRLLRGARGDRGATARSLALRGGSAHFVGAWVLGAAGSTMCACGAALADRLRREASRQPVGARGVTERTDDDGRARASKGRAAPNSKSAGRRPLWVWVTLKARLRELPAIVPIRSGRPDEQEGLQAVRCKGQPFRLRRNLAPTLAAQRTAQGAGSDRRPFGGYCCARASAAAQRNDARPALGPRNKTAFLQPIGWNRATSSANPSRSLIK